MVRCLLVDDEPLALEVLKKYVSTTPGLELVNAFTRPLEAFHFLQHNTIDLLFIDIQMPEITGLAFTRTLKNPPGIIFTTAFREYAVEGFEVQALDYLVKPISYDRFLKALDRYYSLQREPTQEPVSSMKNDPFVFIKVDKAMIKLKLNEICYIEALKNYVRIKTTTREWISYHTLSYMEDKLPTKTFQRIHKSFLVNVEKIDKYTSETIEVHGKELPVGKTFQEILANRLQGKNI